MNHPLAVDAPKRYRWISPREAVGVLGVAAVIGCAVVAIAHSGGEKSLPTTFVDTGQYRSYEAGEDIAAGRWTLTELTGVVSGQAVREKGSLPSNECVWQVWDKGSFETSDSGWPGLSPLGHMIDLRDGYKINSAHCGTWMRVSA